jgi:glucose-1-phosphate cytidylyltransferase
VKVVILCGGMGTRLREETEFRPKPMVTVGGRPILWHIMKLYAHYGFTEFILCLGYRGNMIKEHFLNYEAMNNDFTIELGSRSRIDYHGNHGEKNFKVTLVDTGLDSQTGARVKRIEPYVDGDTFMVTYGDGVADVDIAKLLAFHRSHGRLATVTTVRPTSRFGILEVDDAGVVTHFAEKPTLEGWVSTGFFVFNRKFFDSLDADPSCVLEREPLEELARAGELRSYRHEGFFYAMDTYREFQLLNDLWESGKAPWKVWA